MAPRTIVVTGGSGFTGPFVVRALQQQFPEATIKCLVRPTTRLDELRQLGVEFAPGDLRDEVSLRAAFSGADTLVNVASLGFDWIDPLFSAIGQSKLVRGVFVGTTAILTKLPVKSRATRERGEALVRQSGLDWTLLRPTMIYGTPKDRNVARLIQFVRRWPVIPIVAPEARQQPIHVEDVASAVASALAGSGAVARVYNIAGREALTLQDMVRTVAGALGVRRRIVRVPVSAVRAVVSLHGALSSHPRISLEQIDRLHEDKSIDYTDAARDLEFSPRDFESGVRAEVAMIRGTE